MKKLFLAVVTISFISFSPVNAQKDRISSKTATKAKGYTVLNKEGAIIIYKYQHLSHSPKESEKYAPKYFFTTKSSDLLTLLTKDNLKKAFPDNHAFHDAIDATFKSDKDLTSYDTFHKMYKVNWLLQQHP